MKKIILGLLILIFLASNACGADISKPHVWVDAEVPTAALWNGNEDPLYSTINDLDGDNLAADIAITTSGACAFSGTVTTTGNTLIGNGADTLTVNCSSGITYTPAATWTFTGAQTVAGTWADLGSVTTCDINGGTITGITDLAVADGGTGSSAAANGASGVVILDGAAKLPAVDGSLLTALPAGTVIQVVNVTDGTLDSGAVTIPYDNTIPQVTEGNEWMTLAITPKSATNKLIIEVECLMSGRPGGGQQMTLALFNADFHATNALAVSAGYWDSNITTTMYLRFYVTAGTTSATTFKVRGGSHDAGTVAFNGIDAATGVYGGAAASSITITEISA